MWIIDLVVRNIFFVPQNSIDRFGYSLDDYKSILYIKYLETIKDNVLLKNKRSYLFRIAKNIKIDLLRKYKLNYISASNESITYDEYIEAIDAIHILQEKLTQSEYYLLLKWVFKSYNYLELESGFYYKVQNVLKKAKGVLK